MDRHDALLKARKGLTLIEMAMVCAMSSVIMIAFYAFLSTNTMAAFEETSEIDVQSQLRSAMSAITEELANARLIYIDHYGTFVRYQLPVIGPSGSFVMDNSANIQYGVPNPNFNSSAGESNYVDTNLTNPRYLINGYRELRFVSHTRSEELLNEANLSLDGKTQSLSGTFNAGTANVSNSKVFVYGHFEIRTYNLAATDNAFTVFFTTPTKQSYPSPSGNEVVVTATNACEVRVLPGTVLRELDSTTTTLNTAIGVDEYGARRTEPQNGGIFYSRYPSATLTGSPLGGNRSPQRSGSFNSHSYEMDNLDFTDNDGNNVPNVGTGASADILPDSKSGSNTSYKLRVQLRAFDPRKVISRSGKSMHTTASIRMLTSKINMRMK